MGSNRVRADYDQLSQIARAFQAESDSAQRAAQVVRQAMDTLQGGDWIGPGASAFYAEMTGEVLPSLRRLASALGEAARVSTQISGIVRHAEDAAAAVLRGQAAQGGVALTGSLTGMISGSIAGGGGAGGGYNDNVGIGGAGSGSPNGVGGSASGLLSAIGSNIAKSWGVDAKLYQPKYDLIDGSKDPKKEIEVQADLFAGAAVNEKFADGHVTVKAFGGAFGVKAGVDEDAKFNVGPAGEIYGAKVRVEGTLVGNQELGWTLGGEVKALQIEGFAGIRDSSVGASVGVNLASVKGETGLNIAGLNIGVGAEVGFKYEFGFQIGKDTKVKFGPVTVGISFGGAKK